ncbi:MAG TPA: hypothetical protein VLC11_07670 [Gemmatimonadales bacterium]|nr:hypothetical protein [Gemmatimonadales bacterium]
MTRWAVVALAVVALLAFVGGRGSRTPEVAALRARVDSLTATHHAFVAAQRQTDTVVVADRALASHYIRIADSLRQVADALHRAGNGPRRPVDAPTPGAATRGHFDEPSALRAALDAQTRATAALTVALDTMTAARDAALRRLAVAEAVGRQGLTTAEAGTTWRLGFLRLPRVPKWVAASLGCAAGGYLDRGDPLRGCGLGGVGAVLVAPTR